MICPGFGWDRSSGSGDDFLNFVSVFSLFRNYFLLEKDLAFYLNKLEFPSPKDALYQIWLELSTGFGKEEENVKSLW